MIKFTAAHIAELSGGVLAADPQITPTHVTTDSRDVVPGSLYVARLGENADGHDYIPAALAAGAVLVLGERPTTDPNGNPVPMVIVEDATLAMGSMAADAVRRIRQARQDRAEEFTVIGITGSAGKTTTKDLLHGVLSQFGETVAPQGSYNGEVGVPLTVFRATEDTRFLVIEMGATGIGHINYLASMVRPDIGVVLVVGSAHAGEFGGVENIARAKGELAEAIAADGTVVLNLDDYRVAAMAERASAPVLGFSEESVRQPALLAQNVTSDEAGHPVFDLQFPNGQSAHVHSGLLGMHHMTNLMAAAGAAFAAGLSAAEISSGLSGQQARSRWRMEITERADGITVINDAYNANPESMRAALRTLAQLGRERRTYAVLGAMLELGESSIEEHTRIGTQVVRLNINQLLVVGREARALFISAINEGSWGSEVHFAQDLEEAEEMLNESLQSGDLVLFKSSNGIGLRHLGDRIAWGGHEPAAPANDTVSENNQAHTIAAGKEQA